MGRIKGWRKATNLADAWLGYFPKGSIELTILELSELSGGGYQLYSLNNDTGTCGFVPGTRAKTLEKTRRKSVAWMRRHPKG